MSLLEDLISQIIDIRASIQSDVGEFFMMREKLGEMLKSTSYDVVTQAQVLMSDLDALEGDVQWMVQTLSSMGEFPGFETALEIGSAYGRMKLFISRAKDLAKRAEGTIPRSISSGLIIAGVIGLGVLIWMSRK